MGESSFNLSYLLELNFFLQNTVYWLDIRRGSFNFVHLLELKFLHLVVT